MMERFLGMPIDVITTPQIKLNISTKERSNLFPWNGQFSPQLVETLLAQFAINAKTILDPFVGSGTVIHESAKLSKEVFGAEINPAAVKMAQVYELLNVSQRDRLVMLDSIEDKLSNDLPQSPSLFNNGNTTTLSDSRHALKYILEQTTQQTERIMLEALIVLTDFSEDCTTEKVYKIWSRLRSTILKLEFVTTPVRVIHSDARQVLLPDNSIDFVLTSPPYINVFNYHQQYRPAVESLGWDVLEVAKAEIGSNRKNRGNRFLTVIQYCLELSEVFRELERICRDRSRVILVVGRESNVRKTPFYNGDIVANLAVRSLGWSFLLRQERVFINRFGTDIHEDILHFAIKKSKDSSLIDAREIAREILIDAESRVPEESLVDLKNAIARLSEVESSSVFIPPIR